ncbi:MAG: hypothetical protein QOE06_2915 [Thermoleophilaceae bacterium]|nr:hypothetical protein [Thermoleophilaceae bacterium]
MTAEDRFWTRRLRWRLLGAWRWPAFAVAVVVDAILLHNLSPIRTGIELPIAFILSGFGNLGVIASADAVARFAQRKRAQQGIEDPHWEVQVDRGVVIAFAFGMLGVLGWGLATSEPRVLETKALEQNAAAVERYVRTRGGPEYVRNLETANTARLADGYFRTCISDDRRQRFLCLFVDTNKKPPKVVRDPSTEPNEQVTNRPAG